MYDTPVSLNSYGWDVSYGANWSDSNTTPASAGDPNSVTMTFRYLIPWNTMTTPLGNNGAHSLYPVAVPENGDPTASNAPPLEVSFERYLVGNWGASHLAGPERTVATTENLCIPAENVTANNGTIDYFRWAPHATSSANHPEINFDIVDVDPHDVDIQITCRHADWLSPHADQPHVLTVHRALTAERTHISVDLTDPQLTHLFDVDSEDALRPGAYQFDLHVSEQFTDDQGTARTDAYDLKGHCMLRMPETLPDGHRSHEAFIFDDEKADQVRVRYQLEHDQGCQAADLTLTTFDRKMTQRAVVGLVAPDSATNVYHAGDDLNGDGVGDGILAYRTSADEDLSDYRVLWTAADPKGVGSVYRRMHDNPRMLAVNGPDDKPKALLAVGTLAGVPSNYTYTDRDHVVHNDTYDQRAIAEGALRPSYDLGPANTTDPENVKARRVLIAQQQLNASPDPDAVNITVPEVIAKWAGYALPPNGKIDLNKRMEANAAVAMQLFCHSFPHEAYIVGDFDNAARTATGTYQPLKGTQTIATLKTCGDPTQLVWPLERFGWLERCNFSILVGCHMAQLDQTFPCIGEYITRKGFYGCKCRCSVAFPYFIGTDYYGLWAQCFYNWAGPAVAYKTIGDRVAYCNNWFRTQGPSSANGPNPSRWGDGHYGFASALVFGNPRTYINPHFNE